jgi:hypothetical protein
MVVAPRSPALPIRGPTVDVLQLSGTMGPTADVLQLSGNRSQTSGNASQGATMSRTFLSKKNLGPCAAKDLKR